MATQRLLGRLALAVVLLGVAVVGDTAPASAAACSGTTGVTVVIDNGSATSTRCASGDPSSAMAALQAVASVISPQRFQGSVVCRIDGLPSVADEPCVGMPPEKAYWAFFHASAGGSWTYSTSGVGTYNPKPGSVIGFRFGSGQAPRLAPPAATTPQPKPTPPRVSAVPTPTAPRPGSTGGAKATPAQPSPSEGFGRGNQRYPDHNPNPGQLRIGLGNAIILILGLRRHTGRVAGCTGDRRRFAVGYGAGAPGRRGSGICRPPGCAPTAPGWLKQ